MDDKKSLLFYLIGHSCLLKTFDFSKSILFYLIGCSRLLKEIMISLFLTSLNLECWVDPHPQVYGISLCTCAISQFYIHSGVWISMELCVSSGIL